MAVDIATLGIRVDASQVSTATTALDRLSVTGARAEQQASRLETASAKLTTQIDRLLDPLRAAQTLFAGVIAAESLHRLVEYADSWKLIEGRLRLVTGSGAALADVQQRLFEMSQRTRTSFEGTAELYARVARANGQLGKSQQDLLRFTELTQMAIQTSGAGAQEAAAGVIQLGQALASGQLRGDELRSVLENLNGVAIELAAGMGTTVGQLRVLAEQGKLTSKEIVDALLSRDAEIRERFSSIPLTVGQAFTVLENEVLRFVGEMDTGTGASSALSASLIVLARNLDLGAAAMAAAAAGAAVYALTYLPAVARAALSAAEAIGAFTMALATNPLGLAAVAIAAAVGALFYFRDAVVTVGGQTARVWDVVVATFEVAREVIGGSFTWIGAKISETFSDSAAGKVAEFVGQLITSFLRLPVIIINVVYGTARTITDAFIIAFEEVWAGLQRLVASLSRSFDLIGQAVVEAMSAHFTEAARLAGEALEIGMGGAGERMVARLKESVATNFGTDWWAEFLNGALAGIAGVTDELVQQIAEKAAARYKAASSGQGAGTGQGAPTVAPSVGKTDQAAKRIADVTEQLRFQEAQFGRTAIQQEVYERLQQTGISTSRVVINATGHVVSGLGAQGQALAEAAARVFRMTEAQKEMNDQLERERRLREDAVRLAEQYDPLRAIEAERKRLADLKAMAPDVVDDRLMQRRLDEMTGALLGNGPRVQQVQAQQTAQRQIELLQRVQQLGSVSADLMSAAWEDAYDAMLAVNEDWGSGAIRGLRKFADDSKITADSVAKGFEQAFQGMTDALAEFIMTGKLDFNSMTDSIIKDLIRIQLQASVTGPLANGLSSILGDILGGGSAPSGGAGKTDELTSSGGGFWSFVGDVVGSIFHQGGIAGQAEAQRAVNMTLFAGAPRFHSGGILPGEVPAILQRGEEVLTRDDPRHRWNMPAVANGNQRGFLDGSPLIQIIDQRSGGDSEPIRVQRDKIPDGRDVYRIVVAQMRRDLAHRGELSQALEASFGLSRAGVARR